MIKFYITIGIELLLSPILFFFEWIKRVIGQYISPVKNYKLSNTNNIIDKEVIFAVHEWSGYPFTRKKKINYVNKEFFCGLKFHFDRLSSYKGKYKLRKILTISECDELYLRKLRDSDFYTNDCEIHSVVNKAMDFSGYAHVVENLLCDDKEQMVFLTNTSVDEKNVSFIDEYIELFERDPQIGLLGISYCTKIYQTFIKNNFRPHIQSFFLLSKSSILKELIMKNEGIFPGSNENYKLAIIRFGEVKITEMIQKLGYKVCVITENKKVYTLPNFGFFYNGYSKWRLPMNDYRLHANHPNRINSLSI